MAYLPFKFWQKRKPYTVIKYRKCKWPLLVGLNMGPWNKIIFSTTYYVVYGRFMWYTYPLSSNEKKIVNSD